jgi:hypothetical protein
LVVDLEGNSKPIEEIQEGDSVLARSEFDPQGPLELKRVEEKFVRTAAVMELLSCSPALFPPALAQRRILSPRPIVEREANKWLRVLIARSPPALCGRFPRLSGYQPNAKTSP